MLQLDIVVSPEKWDENKEEFIPPVIKTLTLEHSLVSLAKWESKWCKPFFSREEKTDAETVDYIRCMTITQNVDPDIFTHLTDENINQVNDYIAAPMTATWFTEDKNEKTNREQITNELVYYWMISLNIPFECQKWHINRLLTLIRVCDVKNKPPKKMSQSDMLSRRRALNAARKKQLNSKG